MLGRPYKSIWEIPCLRVKNTIAITKERQAKWFGIRQITAFRRYFMWKLKVVPGAACAARGRGGGRAFQL